MEKIMEKTYRDTLHCNICDHDTEQIVHSSGHERDSSGDWQVCLNCGGRSNGWGEWNTFETPEQVREWYKNIK